MHLQRTSNSIADDRRRLKGRHSTISIRVISRLKTKKKPIDEVLKIFYDFLEFVRTSFVGNEYESQSNRTRHFADTEYT